MHAGLDAVRRIRPLAVGLAALAAAAGCRGNAAEVPGDEAPPTVVLGPTNLAVADTATLASGPIISGALEPELAAQVRAEVGGTVLEVLVDRGETVARGARLARIDDAAVRDAWLSARAGVRTAELNLQLAARNLERSRQLAAAGAIAERDVERADQDSTAAAGALADARARLTQAERQLEKTTLRAPFAGVVGAVPVSAGDVVQPGALIATVVDLSTMELEAAVPSAELAEVRVGAPARFTVAGFGDTAFVGRVSGVSPVADPATGQVPVTIALPNVGHRLVGGLFAQGRLGSEQQTGIVVPTSAVNERGVSPAVLRVKRGRVERVDVALGLRDPAGERVQVTRGLAVGDTVLVAGAENTPVGAIVRTGPESRATPPRTDTLSE